MVEPRMLIVSREMGSRPRCVILTARSAVFICGDTDVTVPCRIVPDERSVRQLLQLAGPSLTILQLDGDRLVGALHQKSASQD